MIISVFNSVKEAYVKQQINADWPTMVEVLTAHNDVANKDSIPLFNLVEFKAIGDPTAQLGRKHHYTNDGKKLETYNEIAGTVRRCKENVVGIWGIMLDVDEKMSIDQAKDMLAGLEYILYTTFRHSPDKHKFRVVLPFSRPLLAADILDREASMQATFPDVDNCSFTISQCFYFHSGPVHYSFHNAGAVIDPYTFAVAPPKVYTPAPMNLQPMSDDFAEAYKAAVRTSLMSCSGLHYAGKGTTREAVLTLVQICRSVGMTFDEYDLICEIIADPESALDRPDVRRGAWMGWTADRITRDKRDRFIQAYGGQPIKMGGSIAALEDKINRDLDRIKELLNGSQ